MTASARPCGDLLSAGAEQDQLLAHYELLELAAGGSSGTMAAIVPQPIGLVLSEVEADVGGDVSDVPEH
jgi:hypothetical protein